MSTIRGEPTELEQSILIWLRIVAQRHPRLLRGLDGKQPMLPRLIDPDSRQ
jgi:hypothetical protein